MCDLVEYAQSSMELPKVYELTPEQRKSIIQEIRSEYTTGDDEITSSNICAGPLKAKKGASRPSGGFAMINAARLNLGFFIDELIAKI